MIRLNKAVKDLVEFDLLMFKETLGPITESAYQLPMISEHALLELGEGMSGP